MTPQEAAKILAKAAAYDNRQPNEAAPIAWAEALDQDLPLADALRIVGEHYQDERTWIMPADINRRWRTLGKTRIREAERQGLPEAPDDIADDAQAWLTWKRAQIRAIKAGATHEQAEASAARAIGQAPTRERRELPAAPPHADWQAMLNAAMPRKAI